MPTERFLRLPKEKIEAIRIAAAKEVYESASGGGVDQPDRSRREYIKRKLLYIF